MGGKDSQMYSYFKVLFIQGFLALKKNVSQLSFLLEIMMKNSDLPCFTNFNLDVFKARFKEKYNDDEVIIFCNLLIIFFLFKKIEIHAEKLIDISCDNWRTIQYDNFQKMTNGIMP
jgi:hypothetical protein